MTVPPDAIPGDKAAIAALYTELDQTQARHRCTAHIDLAAAYMLGSEIMEGARHATAALDIIAVTRRADILRRVTGLYQFAKLARTAAVRELRSRLRLCAPDDYTDRSLVLLDLAACIAADGDWTGALTSAARVLEDLDAAQIQGIIAERARELLAAAPATARALPAARDVRGQLDDTPKEITPP
jgi:DNA-binding response OmpR family regulator